MILLYLDPSHYKGATSFVDIIYYTTSTQSSTGSSYVIPNSNATKILTSIHSMISISVMGHYIFTMFLKKS
jgi:hypothetical protein